MRFESFGPFPIDQGLSRPAIKKFWEDVDKRWAGLPGAIGCYVFSLSYRGKKHKPWYVGKTAAKRGFRAEVFQEHKKTHYKEVMEEYANHSPALFLFPMMTDQWGLSRANTSEASTIKWLETVLIGMALSKNPEIRNTSETRLHRNVYVNQVIGLQWPGRPSRDASLARKLLR